MSTADDVVALIPAGARVFVHGAAMTPTPLLEALARRSVEGVRLYHLHLAGRASFLENPGLRSISLFTGANCRAAVEAGDADFTPIFLSDIPGFFRARPPDVALVQVSPPDRHGLCTLGTSVDAARAAVDTARLVLAEVNERAPRTLGATAVPAERISAFVRTDRPLHAAEASTPGPVEDRIGEQIAALVEDGSTLQMGIGAIPDAALRRMGNKVGLGIHTEMFSDRVIDLMEGGVVTNEHKAVHPNRTVTSFVSGSQRLYDFVDDNLRVEFHPCDRTNDTALIRKNPKVVAINSAIEIDLGGQVCADSLGHRIFSGIGGQMDFIRGAAISPGGKPIIALPSTAAGGAVSRIVATLRPGAGVVTTRGHVHWVVTEYGAVNLHGMTLRERGEALVSVAHPEHRAELARSLRETRHYLV